MLHYQRKKQEELARREAAGENLWTPEVGFVALNRILATWSALFSEARYFYAALTRSMERLNRATGFDAQTIYAGSSRDQFYEAALDEDEEYGPSLIEAFLEEIEQDHDAICALNEILAEERVAFEFIDGQMIEFESKETHEEIVAPTLRLLSGRAGWDKVETAYQNALREIGADPSDAITDAGTALQEALTLLGCEGNALGPLMKSAKKKGLLARHDETLSDGIGKIIDWVSADRSAKGDAHKASPATRDDAWFTVHVVGALILRLAGDSRS